MVLFVYLFEFLISLNSVLPSSVYKSFVKFNLMLCYVFDILLNVMFLTFY